MYESAGMADRSRPGCSVTVPSLVPSVKNDDVQSIEGVGLAVYVTAMQLYSIVHEPTSDTKNGLATIRIDPS